VFRPKRIAAVVVVATLTVVVVVGTVALAAANQCNKIVHSDATISFQHFRH